MQLCRWQESRTCIRTRTRSQNNTLCPMAYLDESDAREKIELVMGSFASELSAVHVPVSEHTTSCFHRGQSQDSVLGHDSQHAQSLFQAHSQVEMWGSMVALVNCHIPPCKQVSQAKLCSLHPAQRLLIIGLWCNAFVKDIHICLLLAQNTEEQAS